MHGIGPGPAAAADVEELALAALALVALEITQLPEKGRIFPDFPERGFFHIAGDAGKVGTGLDVAETVDQADGLGGDAALAAPGGKLREQRSKVTPSALARWGATR